MSAGATGERLNLLRAHTQNQLAVQPESVDANDKLWLLQQVDELLAALKRRLDGALCGCALIGRRCPTCADEDLIARIEGR